MPVDYKLGKVYKIYSAQAEECYVGSSAQKHLSTRFAQHKNSYKKWSADPENEKFVSVYDLLKFGDCVIEILEVSPCTCREELLKKEREWFDKLPCVNRLAPYRTVDEKIISSNKRHKKFRAINKDIINEKSRQRRQDNIHIFLQREAQYREANKDTLASYNAHYFQENKAKLLDNQIRYYNDNKEKILQYYKDNRKIKSQRQREYRARKKAEKEQKQKDENIETNE